MSIQTNTDVARLHDAAVAVLASSPGRELQITNLNKALFYLDLEYLRDSGTTFTGVKYQAIENGPVVEHYRRRLVGGLAEAGLASQYTDGLAKPVRLEPGVEPPNNTELKRRACEVAAKYSSMSASAVSRASHDLAWELAYPTKGTIDMNIALQQLLDDDDDDDDDDDFARIMAVPCEPLEEW